MRIKRGTVSRRKHNKLFVAVKGFRMTKRRLTKVATEARLHAGEYAFAGRRKKKSDYRRLWITRISNTLKNHGLSYSRFFAGLSKAKIEIDRKILADMVVNDMASFEAIIEKVKKTGFTTSVHKAKALGMKDAAESKKIS